MLNRNFLAIVLSITISFLSLHATADAIYFGGWSQHFTPYPADASKGESKYDPSSHPRFNDSQQMLAYEHAGYGAGYFKNSFGQDTYFAVKNFELGNVGYLQANVGVGVDYGYHGCNKKNRSASAQACPLFTASLAYTRFNLQPVIISQVDVFSIALRYSF